jgi:tRNA U34 5-carboxymethylaminomethyl modifying enzyme MnmG/GidA
MIDFLKCSKWLKKTRVKPIEEVNNWMETQGSSRLLDAILLKDLLRRPEITLGEVLKQFGPDFNFNEDLITTDSYFCFFASGVFEEV